MSRLFWRETSSRVVKVHRGRIQAVAVSHPLAFVIVSAAKWLFVDVPIRIVGRIVAAIRRSS